MTGLESASALPNLLGEIYLGGRTGILRLSGDGEELGLCFRKGRFVQAFGKGAEAAPPPRLPPPAPDDELGRHLARVLTELGLERKRPANGGAPPLARKALLEALGWRRGAPAFAEEDVAADLE